MQQHNDRLVWNLAKRDKTAYDAFMAEDVFTFFGLLWAESDIIDKEIAAYDKLKAKHHGKSKT